mgnify:FL=1
MSLLDSIFGEIVLINKTNLVLKTGGFCFNINITSNAHHWLADKANKVKILTYLHVKEDVMELFGFCSEDERNLFMNLKSVSGIGPKSALNILSGSRASNLINSILSEDVKSLTLLPGLGPKTAKRIILELKEKLADHSNKVSSSNSIDNQVLNDARNALISLGYKLKDVNDVISNEYKSKVSNDSLEEIIRKILKKLVK